MTIDLGQTDIELHLDGVMPTNTGIRLNLLSTYSNEYLLYKRGATSTIYDEWFTINFTNDDFTDKGVAGYYVIVIEYFTTDWIEFNRYLIKATNSANSLAIPESFVSDNEQNQNTIYFEG